ncbi:MAG: tetratricopeptide repeat protein [Nitrospirae bacterium]|nr:tetratricopeptide repeat protein [Nitrospirota bacterium]
MKIISLQRIFLSVLSAFLIITAAYAAENTDTPSAVTAENPAANDRLKKAVDLISVRSYKEAEDILLTLAEDINFREKSYILLGRLYEGERNFDKAEEYLTSASAQGHLLRDYALKLLVDIYMEKKEFNKAVVSAGQIRNKTLLQEAKQARIAAWIALEDKKAAAEALTEYIADYAKDAEYKMLLARLIINVERERAINLFKGIYLDATPFAADALKELEVMRADKFTRAEKIRRAGNLFKNGSFRSAEAAYEEILKETKRSSEADNLRYSLATCQFNQKKYSIAANNFDRIRTAEALYWRAKALLRTGDMEVFSKTVEKFKKKYPQSKYYSMLLLLLADENRRKGNMEDAKRVYQKIIADFPDDAEHAFWGLGWMAYRKGNYKESEEAFSRLASIKSSGQYIYWEAKSREILAKDCLPQGVSSSGDKPCNEEASAVYNKLLQDSGYYGFLAKARSETPLTFVKVEAVKPKMPDGEMYERIEALKSVGMKEEAVEEIRSALKLKTDLETLRYLGQTAVELGEYKDVIYAVEGMSRDDVLYLKFPLGFWDTVKEASANGGVDPYLVEALIREESRFDRNAVSVAGAIGLMQLMPYTAGSLKDGLGIEIKESSDLNDANKNILLGTHYFSGLVREFGKIPYAIAAYNAGENAVRRWQLASDHKDIEEFIEDIPYRETRNYVKRVLRSYWQYRALQGLSLTRID